VTARPAGTRPAGARAPGNRDAEPRPYSALGLSPAPIGFFWGDDALAVRRAVERFAAALAGGGTDGGSAAGAAGAEPLEIVAVDAADIGRVSGRQPAGEASAGDGGIDTSELAVRLATAPLFGRGVLVVLREPATLARGAAGREQLLRLAAEVAPGNGLAFTAVLESRAKEPAGLVAIRAAVEAAGGVVEHLESPRQGRLAGWIQGRSRELGLRIDAPGARELADRIGGSGAEGDVDRRRHTELADAELHKLALYRPEGPITREDVAALVPSSAPASSWVFLDAVGRRDIRAAGAAVERLLAEGTPLPVVVTQLHRRLRQLLVIRSLSAAGERPPAIAKAAGISGTPKAVEFRYQMLSRQAAAWEPEELTVALAALVEEDLVSKGLPVNGRPPRRGSAEWPTALLVWLSERVAVRR
jgi:DNA polymerase III delta subunit